MATQVEIERKYDVDESAVVPALGDLATVVPHGEAQLEAEYYDTDQFALARRKVVLRRRVGGADEGWHVKRAAAIGRTEQQWPLSGGEVPEVVLVAVRSIVRDHPLHLIATISTHRTTIHLLNQDGEELAELADDVVSASDTGSGIVRTWREWEVELLGGVAQSDPERDALLDAVELRLLAAGATPAASASKLASALGRTGLGAERADARPATTTGSKPVASELLLAVVTRLVDEMGDLDPRVRENSPDSVHQLRTRVRRLRSLFQTYPTVFSPTATRPLAVELSRLGSLLGVVRDAEVMRDRARALARDHHVVVGDAVVGNLAQRYAEAHAIVLAELSRSPYYRLRDELDEFVARPPLGALAFERARDLVPVALRRELTLVLTRARKAETALTEPQRIILLHDTRRAAKRLRYAAEAVSSERATRFGVPLQRLGAAAQAVHDLLGEHRDSVLMQEYLRQAAGTATGTGENAFDLGILHEVERHGAALCLAEYPAALAELRALR